MASAVITPSTPPRSRYSTFRRPSTLMSPKNPHTNVPLRLTQKMTEFGLASEKPVRDFVLWTAEELQEEDKRYGAATNLITDLSKRLSALEEQVKEMPKLEEQVKGLQEQVKEMPKLEEQLKDIPKLQEQVKEMPKLEEQLKEIPKLQEQVKEMPKLEEQVKELQEQVIPKLQERIQGLEDERKKTRGVATKGLFASLRELIKWGITKDTVINKTVEAYNKKLAAGGKEIQASDVKADAETLIPVLHMGIHVCDMLDWEAALATLGNDLTNEYSVGKCLAETAFEQVFGYNPTNPGSQIFQENKSGPILKRVLQIYGTAHFLVKEGRDGCYASNSTHYFNATPEAVTSHFEPILFARNKVLDIIQHSGDDVDGDIPEREQVITNQSEDRIRILKECYRQWRRFHDNTYADSYANKKGAPEGVKSRILLLRKTPATTDEDVRRPLAEDSSEDGSADGGSINGEKGPEETCGVCHLPGHGRSLCPWAE